MYDPVSYGVLNYKRGFRDLDHGILGLPHRLGSSDHKNFLRVALGSSNPRLDPGRVRFRAYTWTPRVCKLMVFVAPLRGFWPPLSFWAMIFLEV